MAGSRHDLEWGTPRVRRGRRSAAERAGGTRRACELGGRRGSSLGQPAGPSELGRLAPPAWAPIASFQRAGHQRRVATDLDGLAIRGPPGQAAGELVRAATSSAAHPADLQVGRQRRPLPEGSDRHRDRDGIEIASVRDNRRASGPSAKRSRSSVVRALPCCPPDHLLEVPTARRGRGLRPERPSPSRTRLRSGSRYRLALRSQTTPRRNRRLQH